jgi:hypothetical protein
VDAATFTLRDAGGTLVPARVGQIGDGVYGLFPHQVLLAAGQTYTARVAAGACDQLHNCIDKDFVWTFTVAAEPEQATGDTSITSGFGRAAPGAVSFSPPP